jgi:23S rRNA (uracil1939-C5)-methyltransferase
LGARHVPFGIPALAFGEIRHSRYTNRLLLTIEKLIYGGDGLARFPGADGRAMTVFIPFVLPEERVEVDVRPEKAGFARGTIKQLVSPSSDRIEARCPYFRSCGGCHYQHIPYEQQLQFKSAILRETVRRIAKIELPEVRLHPSPPWNYRNRARLQVRNSADFQLGYFRFASHEFLSIRECPINSPLINRLIARLIELGGLNCPPVSEIEVFADASDERLLAWVFADPNSDLKRLQAWAEEVQTEIPEIVGLSFFSTSRQSTGRQSGEDDSSHLDSHWQTLLHCGARTLSYRTQCHEYRVRAGAFFQVNRHLVDDLVSTVTGSTKGELVLDLYAGVGLFSSVLAKKFRHNFAVESSPISQADLRHNVPANVNVVSARVEDYLRSSPNQRKRPLRPDLIVLDPPRTGVGKAATGSLAKLGASEIRYVSCDPATLARDLVSLTSAGYRIQQVHLFDLFPQTFHIESVVFLDQ